MSSKSTWMWLAAAMVLFGFIFVFQRYFRHEETGPRYLLPALDPKSVTTLQIRPAGQPEIRVGRTNGSWQLFEPIAYPAQGTNIDNLLTALSRLTVAHSVSEQELRKDPDADENYGIEPPQLSLVLIGHDSTNRIYFGHHTAPGDQVFVRIIGLGGVSVVDADILNLFPGNIDAWRDPALVDFSRISFDQVSVTNALKNTWFQLQRDPTNRLWSMTAPMKARADSEIVAEALRHVENLRVRQFASDDPKADLDAFGLQPPQFTIAFANGTNGLVEVDFGKELTNAPGLLYARRRDQDTIVAVSTNTLGSWRSSYEIFRDRHLVTLTGPLDKIEIQARDNFSVVWQTNSWRVMPQNFPADTALASGLARTFGDLQVADFEKDSVTKPDLAHYGLATPVRKYILVWANSPDANNAPVELDFGTNSDGKIFAQRIGEDAVYGITPGDFDKLPTASWEIRQRQIWDFDLDDISQITIQQDGHTRELMRHSTNGWALAAGTQGIVNDSGVEDTARELGHLSAFTWVNHGSRKLPDYGFAPNGYQLSIGLKNGEKFNVQFGGPTRFGTPYAVVNLDNEPWIFEFPPDLFGQVRDYLSIPVTP